MLEDEKCGQKKKKKRKSQGKLRDGGRRHSFIKRVVIIGLVEMVKPDQGQGSHEAAAL